MSSTEVIVYGGYFTSLGYVEGLSGPALERALGFHAGRLSRGFQLLALSETEWMGPADFDLQASTRWSGGVLPAASSRAPSDIETILAARGQDLPALKAKVAAYFARRGRATPAKVSPKEEHRPGMHYPGAEALAPGVPSGVPQFKLLRPKRFCVIGAGIGA